MIRFIGHVLERILDPEHLGKTLELLFELAVAPFAANRKLNVSGLAGSRILGDTRGTGRGEMWSLTEPVGATSPAGSVARSRLAEKAPCESREQRRAWA